MVEPRKWVRDDLHPLQKEFDEVKHHRIDEACTMKCGELFAKTLTVLKDHPDKDVFPLLFDIANHLYMNPDASSWKTFSEQYKGVAD